MPICLHGGGNATPLPPERLKTPFQLCPGVPYRFINKMANSYTSKHHNKTETVSSRRNEILRWLERCFSCLWLGFVWKYVVFWYRMSAIFPMFCLLDRVGEWARVSKCKQSDVTVYVRLYIKKKDWKIQLVQYVLD